MWRKVLVILIGFIWSINFNLKAQTYNAGWLPKINFSKKIITNTKWVSSLESRQLIYQDIENPSFSYHYVLTDFTNLLSFKVGANYSLNAGYLFRLEENEVIHRSIQQFVIISKTAAFRFGHRFATDQTFTQEEKPAYRLRYRITLERALSGFRIDKNEFYLKINNEYLGELQDTETSFEIRLVPALGYEIGNFQKIEMGFDHRISKPFTSDSKNTSWFTITWYCSLR